MVGEGYPLEIVQEILIWPHIIPTWQPGQGLVNKKREPAD